MEDPRRKQGRRHRLEDVLMLTICAVVCGANNWVEVEEYGKAKREWLSGVLELPHGIPSHDTLSDVFARLDPQKLAAGFQSWVNSLAVQVKGMGIQIDGKVLRGSGEPLRAQSPLHLVSAWVESAHLLLGQVRTADKSNEITAIPQLLELLAVEGCLVTIDAMGTQSDIAARIVKGGGDYLLAVKENHKGLLEDIEDLFAGCDEVGFAKVPHDSARTVNKGHGRIEVRRCWTLSDPVYLDHVRQRADWVNLSTLVRVERQRQDGDKKTRDVAYFLSSRQAPAADFLHAVRQHWAIENQLHWSLDVAFREDDNRTRAGHSAENLALIRRLVLLMLKRETSVKAGLQAKRLRAGWNNDYLASVLSS